VCYGFNQASTPSLVLRAARIPSLVWRSAAFTSGASRIGRKKSDTTKAAVEHYVRGWIVPRWGGFIADEIKPLDVQRWLNSLQTNKGIACTTAAKIRGIFSRIFKIGLRYELVTRNPVEGAQTSQATDYQAIVLAPDQTLKIWRAMNHPLHQILVLTCAATGLRASEALALRWTDLLWSENRIRISKRWALGAAGPVKTKSSKGYVPMHPVLAQYLADWKTQSPHSKDTDFIFPSLREGGRKPLYASSFVADYLRPAAIAAGVQIADGQRFGLHNLRHSLSNWLINQAETDPKTVQGLLRHSKIQTTLDLYTQTDRNKAQIAQGQFLEALGLTSTIQ
jgi:integrase